MCLPVMRTIGGKRRLLYYKRRIIIRGLAERSLVAIMLIHCYYNFLIIKQ